MKGYVRPLAICVFRKDNMIFVGEGYDPTNKEVFYRPLGGAIQFGEYGRQAIAREIREEIGAEITDLRYVGTIENLFTYDGQPGHEIVLVYEGRLTDQSLYEKAQVSGCDDGIPFKAVWKLLADFQSGDALLVPEGLLELLM